MKDFTALSWSRFQQRRPRLPGGQVHIPTAMEGATSRGGSTEADTPWLPWAQGPHSHMHGRGHHRGRQHGADTPWGPWAPGEGSGHRQEQHRLLQLPSTQLPSHRQVVRAAIPRHWLGCFVLRHLLCHQMHGEFTRDDSLAQAASLLCLLPTGPLQAPRTLAQ